jgi:hypothetical protein
VVQRDLKIMKKAMQKKGKQGGKGQHE